VKLSDFIVDFLARKGLKNIFLLPGGGSMHLVDSAGKHPDLGYVVTLHEQAAAIAADAYAQFNGHLGCCLVTTGPGGTNAITGVMSSWLDGVPVFVLSGQVKRADLMAGTGLRSKGFQEVDTIEIVKSFTKYAVTVQDPQTIRYHMERAYFESQNGRKGPVWIDVPLDVQSADVDPVAMKGFDAPAPKTAGANVLGSALDTLRSRLATAQRPCFLIGNGVRMAGASQVLKQVLADLDVPVLATWRAADLFPEDTKYYFGRPGAIGQRAANFIQQNSDLIIVLGARLDTGQVAYSYENFARAAHKIVVDIDASELEKLTFASATKVVSDAKEFVDALAAEHGRWKLTTGNIASWKTRCREWVEKYPIVLPEYREQKTYANSYVLLDLLSELLTPNDVMVPGSSGACSDVTMQTFRVKDGQRMLNSTTLGAMGFGLPATIGACIAAGRRRTININGDGGFQLNIQELETVVREKLPIKYFILNNDGYGSIRNTQRNYFNERWVGSNRQSRLSIPDMVKVPQAYGLEAFRVHNNTEMRKIVEHALSLPGPTLCDVMVDPEETVAPKTKSEVLPNGSLRTKPMEDLWPFLDREEFKAQMLIPTVNA